MYKHIQNTPPYLLSVIVTNLIYYGFLIPAAIIFPGYSPFTNTVSALGNTTRNPNGWFLFSICLSLMAISLLPFIYQLKKWYQTEQSTKKYIIPIQILGYFNSISLVMIAINPTDTASAQHNFWSLMNFICIELVILLAIIGLRNHPNYWNRISIIAIFDFFFCIIYLATIKTWEFSKTFEWLTFIFILGYLLLFSINMHKEGL